MAECRAGIDGFAKADAAWKGQLGYLAYADWAERYLGDRNGLPSPFEVDRNGDGKITLDELGERIDAIFARFDKDKDGVLTRAELLTIRTSPTGDRPNRRRDDRLDQAPPRR